MADFTTKHPEPTLASEQSLESPIPKPKWTSQLGNIVRTTSQRLYIRKKHPNEESPAKDKKPAGGHVLKRTSSWMSSISASKQSFVSRRLRRDSTHAASVVAAAQPPSNLSATSSLQNLTVLDESMVIIPLNPAAEEPLAATSSLDPKAYPLLDISLVEISEVSSSSNLKPVLAQVSVDGSMVEMVVPLEEDDDTAAVALPHQADSAPSAGRAKGLEATNHPPVFAVPERVTNLSEAGAHEDVSDEDQQILDSALVPHEDDDVVSIEPIS